MDTADFICPPEDLSFQLGGNYYDSESMFSYAQLDLKACVPS